MDFKSSTCRCHVARKKGKRQATLSSRLGFLRLGPPDPIPEPRTPAPHAVRKIANTPVFRTTDTSLTEFLRFPAEIRLVIYRLLLTHESLIYYTICPNTDHLVLRDLLWSAQSNQKPPSQRHPYYRHGLFPAILECCRLTYNEGRAILYRENEFWATCGNGAGVLNSWPLSPEAFSMFGSIEFNAAEGDLLHIGRFTNLAKLQIRRTWKISEWESFTQDSLALLGRIDDVTITISVPLSEPFTFWPDTAQPFTEAMEQTFRGYKNAIGVEHAICRDHHVHWEVVKQRSTPMMSWDTKLRLRLTRKRKCAERIELLASA